MGINPHRICFRRRSCSFVRVLTRNALNFLAYEIFLSVSYPIHPGFDASHNAQNTIQCRDETQMFSIVRVINMCYMHALVTYRTKDRENERECAAGVSQRIFAKDGSHISIFNSFYAGFYVCLQFHFP